MPFCGACGHARRQEEALEEDTVGGKEIQRGKFFYGEPAGLLALVTDSLGTRRDAAFHEVQADRRRRVGMLHLIEQHRVKHLKAQLFGDLPADAGDQTLPPGNFAAGELPLACQATPWGSRGQEKACSPADDSGADVYQRRYFGVPTMNCARRFMACCASPVAFGTAGFSSP